MTFNKTLGSLLLVISAVIILGLAIGFHHTVWLAVDIAVILLCIPAGLVLLKKKG